MTSTTYKRPKQYGLLFCRNCASEQIVRIANGFGLKTCVEVFFIKHDDVKELPNYQDAFSQCVACGKVVEENCSLLTLPYKPSNSATLDTWAMIRNRAQRMLKYHESDCPLTDEDYNI